MKYRKIIYPGNDRGSIVSKNLWKANLLILFFVILTGCSITKQIDKQAHAILLNDTAISKGFIGISIYEPSINKYWYNYNATKYFTPASNTKLFTLYAGMKYLGDSLLSANISEDQEYLYIFPNGDPSFLNEEFNYQPLSDLLKQTHKKIKIIDSAWKENALGYGWSWDDYNDDYMAERSAMPVFGNVLNAKITPMNSIILPHFFNKSFIWDSIKKINDQFITVTRDRFQNVFRGSGNAKKEIIVSIPFLTQDGLTNYQVLEDVFGKKIEHAPNFRPAEPPMILHHVFSQPKDSLFKPMMHRSDNFFAEQTLLMVSNEHLGYMSDKDIIDTLLRSDLKDIPQKPNWVDGSGLSRYNLFTPQSFIYILNKMRVEFGWDRLKGILPTGGEGTLRSYFKKERGVIYAKTGTLSNNCSLSGFLVTNKGKLLIFSILANHYQSSATPIRKATERFLAGIREKF